jgi:hypothetical protein
MVRTCGKNARRNNCEEGFLVIPQREKGLLKNQERNG